MPDTQAFKPVRDQAVKLDAFHALHRYGPGLNSKKDPLVAPFMSALSKAMFILDTDDVSKLKDWLKENRKFSDEQIDKLPMAYFVRSRSVRRYIPPPVVLASRLVKWCKLSRKRSWPMADLFTGRRVAPP